MTETTFLWVSSVDVMLDRGVLATLGMQYRSLMPEVAAGVLEAWDLLPRRLFLDSSTLQTLLNYGGSIWENEDPHPGDRACRMPGFVCDLRALQAIFRVNARAGFDFALSGNSLREVIDKQDSSYVRWASDVLDHWQARVEEYRGTAFSGRGLDLWSQLDEPHFGYLGAKDRLLLRDAVALECDAFLTMERKLSKNADHLGRSLGIQVLRPREYWELLRPFAALYC